MPEFGLPAAQHALAQRYADFFRLYRKNRGAIAAGLRPQAQRSACVRR
jgi:hypothetical protein